MLPTDPRVRFENGAASQAELVGQSLDDTVRSLESLLGRPFLDAVRVDLTATQSSFGRRIGRPGDPATGAVLLGRVLLSPRSFREGRWRGILAHELTHLHLRQHLGAGVSIRTVPGWFHEGLPVFASGGGGAEPVSAATALRAIADGRSFRPDDTGRWLVPRTARSYGLPHHMFYRPAGQFVSFLHDRDPAAFRCAYGRLLDGASFASAFSELGWTVDEAWRAFVVAAKSS